VDARDSEVVRELDLNDVLNGGLEVVEDAVTIDVGEQVRRLDEVPSGPGFGEVVSNGAIIHSVRLCLGRERSIYSDSGS